jgi:hypothetical protein
MPNQAFIHEDRVYNGFKQSLQFTPNQGPQDECSVCTSLTGARLFIIISGLFADLEHHRGLCYTNKHPLNTRAKYIQIRAKYTN